MSQQRLFDQPDKDAVNELGTLRQVVALARRVRVAQVAYFTSRTPKALKEAKALEAQLDSKLKELP